MSVKTGDKIKIIGNSVGHGVPNGTIAEVIATTDSGSILVMHEGIRWMIHPDDYEKVHIVLDLIAKLSAEVARLSKRVAMLENQNAPVRSIKERYEAHKQTLKAREEIVAKAKSDVDNLTKRMGSDNNEMVGNKYFRNYATRPEFVINREKRTVVSLVKGKYHPTLYSKGIAEASPEDCFNVHIGKAIALRRALGLEVPDEYLNAPQPTEVHAGDILKWGSVNCTYKCLTIEQVPGNIVIIEPKALAGYKANGDTFTHAKIIDDSDRK